MYQQIQELEESSGFKGLQIFYAKEIDVNSLQRSIIGSAVTCPMEPNGA